MAVDAAVSASRRCADQPRLRRRWRWLALAFASYLTGDVSWGVYVLAGSKPYPSVADGFYLLFDPLMLWGPMVVLYVVRGGRGRHGAAGDQLLSGSGKA